LKRSYGDADRDRATTLSEGVATSAGNSLREEGARGEGGGRRHHGGEEDGPEHRESDSEGGKSSGIYSMPHSDSQGKLAESSNSASV